jgi:tyrosyl-DNA phosphodiesterase-1
MDPKESEIIEILSDTEDEVEIIVPTSSTSKRPPPIEIEDDEARFSNELQRAIEASKKVPNPATSSQPEASTSTDAQKSSFISERAALEKARLERQKRLMGESFFEDDRPSKKSFVLPPSSLCIWLRKG